MSADGESLILSFSCSPTTFQRQNQTQKSQNKKLAVPRSEIFQESLKTATYQVNSIVLLNWT